MRMTLPNVAQKSSVSNFWNVASFSTTITSCAFVWRSDYLVKELFDEKNLYLWLVLVFAGILSVLLLHSYHPAASVLHWISVKHHTQKGFSSLSWDVAYIILFFVQRFIDTDQQDWETVEISNYTIDWIDNRQLSILLGKRTGSLSFSQTEEGECHSVSKDT